MNVYLTGAIGTGFGSYVKNLVFNGPGSVNYFYDRKWLDYWQFKNLLPSHRTGKSSKFPVSTAILKAFPPLKWFHSMCGFDFPYVQYFKIKDGLNIHLTHSNLRLLIHNRPWVVVFDSPALLTCFRVVDAEKFTYCKYPRIVDISTRKLVLSKNCKRILPFSEKAKEEFLMYFKVPEEKIQVVPPGIPFPQKIVEKRSDDKLTILFVGRRFYRKGGKIILDVFEKLSKKYDDIYLVLKTRTPESSMMLKDLRRIKENKRITLISTQTTNKLDKLYSNADIFVLPTIMDFFPLVVLEAMSFGLPVVASNVYAISEIIEDSKTGFLFSRGDHMSLEEKLRTLIESKSLRRRTGKAGRKRVEEHFSNITVNKKLKTVYEETLKK